MKGYIYTTRGADPGRGIVLNDPIYGDTPTLGACMPNIRRQVEKGDYIFSISGKSKGFDQYIIGGFEVERKLHALAALEYFPENVVTLAEDNTKRGNIIVNPDGTRNKFDNHTNFEKRLDNYIVGKNGIYLSEGDNIDLAREETLEILRTTFGKNGDSVQKIIGRCRKMDEKQIRGIVEWLESIKKAI